MKSNFLVYPKYMSYSSNVSQNGVCLHIGCGLHAASGWENIDASPSLRISKIYIVGRFLLSLSHGPNWSKTVQYGDVVKGIRNKENRCQLIFAAHVLEHLTLTDFHIALTNIYSYLEPGGTFRFIVPDLKQYVDTYIKHYSDPALSIKASEEFMAGSLLGSIGSRKSLYHRLREALSNSKHQWMWDEASLLNTLTKHGFKSVRMCQYDDWSDSRFSMVETKDKYGYAIGIEAIK
ncbi:MAG: methyltransferase domain-containing protein [Nostoc sp.]|uniref:class I SAM-dependent methyltransferase n=1 Tax=Nostoc sp. TaxID=1180 RepID=UPI002FFA5A8C